MQLQLQLQTTTMTGSEIDLKQKDDNVSMLCRFAKMN